MELSYHEIPEKLDAKYIAASFTEYTLPPGLFENSNINLILKSLHPGDKKIKITIDDIRYRSILAINKSVRFTSKKVFCTKLGFTQSYSGSLNDLPQGYIQMIAGIYKSNKPINITGIHEIQSKCNYKNGSIVNGVREPILYSFALDTPPGQKIYKEPRIKLFKKQKNMLCLEFCSI